MGQHMGRACFEAHLTTNTDASQTNWVGNTLISPNLTPPVMAPAWQGLGGRLVMRVRSRQGEHGGGLGSGGGVSVGARLGLSPGL